MAVHGIALAQARMGKDIPVWSTIWNALKGFGRWMKGYLALHHRVKALEEAKHPQELREKQNKQLREKVVCRDGAYYLTEQLAGYARGPFCATCWRPPGKHDLVLMCKQGYAFDDHDDQGRPVLMRRWVCGVCNTWIDLPVK